MFETRTKSIPYWPRETQSCMLQFEFFSHICLQFHLKHRIVLHTGLRYIYALKVLLLLNWELETLTFNLLYCGLWDPFSTCDTINFFLSFSWWIHILTKYEQMWSQILLFIFLMGCKTCFFWATWKEKGDFRGIYNQI